VGDRGRGCGCGRGRDNGSGSENSSHTNLSICSFFSSSSSPFKRELGYEIASLVPVGSKNFGFLFAIQNGATTILETIDTDGKEFGELVNSSFFFLLLSSIISFFLFSSHLLLLSSLLTFPHFTVLTCY
jgi:hypothetical protein